MIETLNGKIDCNWRWYIYFISLFTRNQSISNWFLILGTWYFELKRILDTNDIIEDNFDSFHTILIFWYILLTMTIRRCSNPFGWKTLVYRISGYHFISLFTRIYSEAIICKMTVSVCGEWIRCWDSTGIYWNTRYYNITLLLFVTSVYV